MWLLRVLSYTPRATVPREFFLRAPSGYSVCECQNFTACTVRHLPIFSHMCPSVCASYGTFLRLRFQRRFSATPPPIGGFSFFPRPCLPPIRHTMPCRFKSWSSVRQSLRSFSAAFEFRRIPLPPTCGHQYYATSFRCHPASIRRSSVILASLSNSSFCHFVNVAPVPLWEVTSRFFGLSTSQFRFRYWLYIVIHVRRIRFHFPYFSIPTSIRLSGFVPTIPATIRHGSVFICIRFKSASHLMYLRLPKLWKQIINCSVPPLSLITISHGLRQRCSGAGPVHLFYHKLGKGCFIIEQVFRKKQYFWRKLRKTHLWEGMALLRGAPGDKNQYNLFCRHRRFHYFF